jgi:predicted nucleotidyltransferase
LHALHLAAAVLILFHVVRILDWQTSNKLFSPISTERMMKVAAKPERRSDTHEVTYNDERWRLLLNFRQKAQGLLVALEARRIQAVVHGSIARGDVNKDSDIDIFIPNPPSSFLVETALEQAKIPVAARMVIQATPAYAMKAYIEVNSATTVSFPLMAMRRVEREFYRFSGEVTLAQLRQGTRVAGVDKRLMLIEPTEKGHVENSVIGCEEQIAKTLGIAVETVLDRIHALMKRDTVGRTGVFVKRELASDETFELTLKRLRDENPAVRRRLNS